MVRKKGNKKGDGKRKEDRRERRRNRGEGAKIVRRKERMGIWEGEARKREGKGETREERF